MRPSTMVCRISAWPLYARRDYGPATLLIGSGANCRPNRCRWRRARVRRRPISCMHICSRFTGGVSTYANKGYGRFEYVTTTKYRNKDSGTPANRRGGHQGLDMHAVKGQDAVFAAHAGKYSQYEGISSRTGRNVGGHVSAVTKMNIAAARNYVSYLHLDRPAQRLCRPFFYAVVR